MQWEKTRLSTMSNIEEAALGPRSFNPNRIEPICTTVNACVFFLDDVLRGITRSVVTSGWRFGSIKLVFANVHSLIAIEGKSIRPRCWKACATRAKRKQRCRSLAVQAL